jgi:hypothetical protein
MTPSGEGHGTEDGRHLVTVEPVPGQRAWEAAWCTCGAAARFSVVGRAEDWVLTHVGVPLAPVGCPAARAS